MDEITNPYAPGAGWPPPALAGRKQLIHDAHVAIQRIKVGEHARSSLITGLRGVGKTVLLNRLSEYAREECGYATDIIEADANRALATLLAPALRKILHSVDVYSNIKHETKRAFALLRGFAAAFKVSYSGVDVGVEAASGADTGDLELDLPELLMAVGHAASVNNRHVAIFIDELQYVGSVELGALIKALHRVAQLRLPILIFGAGLPNLLGIAGEAKSYAERLFSYPKVGALSVEEVQLALATPASDRGVTFEDSAIEAIMERTQGYPYFIQEWGKHCWNVASGNTITATDVEAASGMAIDSLDHQFFLVRFDRLTTKERTYLRAMAELGQGPHLSREIATKMQTDVNSAGTLKNRLDKKGMIYSPKHGLTAFTVPMFDTFLRRQIPFFDIAVENLTGSGTDD